MNFLGTFEARLRASLKRRPILYAFVAGVGIILFWRGIWHLADFFALVFLSSNDHLTTIDWSSGVDSAISLIIGSALLLSTGLFVSELLSGQILITDAEKEKKVAEETKQNVEKETAELPSIEKEIEHIAEEVGELQERLKKKK